jgi:hypothetical protein
MDHRWHGSDIGLIWCWESGRMRATDSSDLAARAKSGELIELLWKGGVKPGLKLKKKLGTFQYLAYWQGLSGNDLDIDTDATPTLVCSASGVEVTFCKEAISEDA